MSEGDAPSPTKDGNGKNKLAPSLTPKIDPVDTKSSSTVTNAPSPSSTSTPASAPIESPCSNGSDGKRPPAPLKSEHARVHRVPQVDDDSIAAAPPSRRGKKAKLKESIIDHTYRDFSQVKVAPDEADDDNGKNRPNFPAKLHGIVSNPNYQHIICWLPHGRSWKIVDKYLLTSVIIPQHFSHAKFESFNRSVNGWGFKRLLNTGPDCKSYYHECFLRGRPELTSLMQRLVNPGKRLPDKSGEPDFYAISKNFPLPPSPGTVRPPMPTSMTHAAIPQERKAGTSGGDMLSPNKHQPGPPVGFPPAPPGSHLNGYSIYGYPQAPMYPQMPSPGANQGADHRQQQQQQMYWPAQIQGSPPYQPTPSPYGYYPYQPQMMMMAPQAGPQGYYNMGPPYPQPGMYNPYYPSMSTAGGTQQGNNPLADAPEGIKPPKQTSSSDASPDSVKKLGEPGQYKNSAGLAAVAEVASVAGDDVGDSEETKLDEQTASNAESTTEI